MIPSLCYAMIESRANSNQLLLCFMFHQSYNSCNKAVLDIDFQQCQSRHLQQVVLNYVYLLLWTGYISKGILR